MAQKRLPTCQTRCHCTYIPKSREPRFVSCFLFVAAAPVPIGSPRNVCVESAVAPLCNSRLCASRLGCVHRHDWICASQNAVIENARRESNDYSSSAVDKARVRCRISSAFTRAATASLMNPLDSKTKAQLSYTKSERKNPTADDEIGGWFWTNAFKDNAHTKSPSTRNFRKKQGRPRCSTRVLKKASTQH